MANNPGRPSPRRFVAGDQISAEQLSRIVDELTRRIVGGDGVRVRTFGRNQIVIEAKPTVQQKRADVEVKLFRVLYEQDDYVYVTPALTGEGMTAVLKPYELQKTPYHEIPFSGVTYTYGQQPGTRIAKGNINWYYGIAYAEEGQVIWPPYSSGSILVAIKVNTENVFGMTYMAGNGVGRIKWMDITPCRAWTFSDYAVKPEYPF